MVSYSPSARSVGGLVCCNVEYTASGLFYNNSN